MRSAPSVLTMAALLSFSLTAASFAGPPEREVRVLAEGTPFETPAYIHDTGEPGPTVVITAGIHGDEPASVIAADQIRHWPLATGRLVVVPRVNRPALGAGKRRTPGDPAELSDVNRNFTRTEEVDKLEPRGPLATAVWALVKEEQPDWLLDLHEGTDVHLRKKSSVGRSIIAPSTEEIDRVVASMLTAVNTTVSGPEVRFVRLTKPKDGSLARAAHDRLSVRAMIVESAKRGFAKSTRAREHRVMVHALLTELKMLAPGVHPADVGYLDGARAARVIGIYDGSGAAGRGVPLLLAQLPRLRGTVAARIGPTEIRAGSLDHFDVVVFSGGSGSGQAKMLGETGRAAVKRFVDGGGGYLGICAGAYLATTNGDNKLAILDARTNSPYWKRGSGTVQLELLPAGRAALGGPEGEVGVRYANGPVIEPSDDPAIPDYETLAVFRSEMRKNRAPKGVMVGSPAAVAGRFGEGRVVCFSPHPEQTKGLEGLVLRAVEWLAPTDAGSPQDDE